MDDDGARTLQGSREILQRTTGQQPMGTNYAGDLLYILTIVFRVEPRNARLRNVLHRVEHSANVHHTHIEFGNDTVHLARADIVFLTPHRMDAHRSADDLIRLVEE